MKEIKLSMGMVALVDDDIFNLLNKSKWFAHKTGNHYYAVCNIPFKDNSGRTIWKMGYMHHFILGKPISGLVVDHIDCNGLNNTKDNLRVVTRRQNHQNRKDKHLRSSQFPGVSWDTNAKKWRAQIQVSSVSKNLGYYTSEEEAFSTYQRAVNTVNELVINYES